VVDEVFGVDAWRAAHVAQERAGISIRTLDDPNQQGIAVRIFDQVWPLGSGGTNVTSNLLRALLHSGGYASAAFDDRDGAPIGAALAVVGRHRSPEDSSDPWHTHLHSHMAAVVEEHRDRSIGTAIKLHQRAWALSQGIDTIVWSFDPLVRRNAWLNLHKLGTEVRGYEANFYGDMDDAINAGDPSDRVFAWWLLTSDRAVQAAAQPLPAVRVADLRDVRIIDTPEDIVAVRRQSPTDAVSWRMSVRQQFLDAFEAGYRVIGLDTDGSYVLTGEKER
jgi:predicted GNAT superfamily acetyltransferase